MFAYRYAWQVSTACAMMALLESYQIVVTTAPGGGVFLRMREPIGAGSAFLSGCRSIDRARCFIGDRCEGAAGAFIEGPDRLIAHAGELSGS